MMNLRRAVPLLFDFLLDAAARVPDKVALVCAGQRLTYRELDASSTALAWQLTRRGVEPSDRVMIFADNTVETVISFWAALKASAVPVVISPQVKSERLAYLLDDCRPAALISETRLRPVLEGPVTARTDLRVVILAGPGQPGVPGAIPWAEAAGAASPDQPPARLSIDEDLAAIIYTSGSTGEPKGVMHTHRSMRAAALSITTYLENREDEVILGLLPLSFDYGLYQMIMAVALGGRLVLERSFAYPTRVLETAARERVTGFPGVPTVYAMMASMKNLDAYDLSSVRYVTNTAAALFDQHIALLRRVFPQARIYSMYGLTECKRVSYLPPADLERKPHSVGLPIPNTDVWVAGDNGERLGPGTVGQIVVRGATLMRGYWEKPEATAEKLWPGPLPWEPVLHTGDYGWQDDEGYLYFVGRMDDVIKSRGEKVAPREIENTLMSITGVREAAVIGIEDDVLGQAPKAFVTLEPGSELTPRALQRACSKTLESFKVPRDIEIVSSLPQTTTGKIKKSGLGQGAVSHEPLQEVK